MSPTEEIFEAVKAADPARVEALLARDPALANARNAGGLTPVVVATYYGRKEMVDLLLARGAELDVFAASALGKSERIEALLRGDRSLVNAYSPDGWTPLALAAYFGHADAARLLLAHGADVHARSKNATGNTPLHAAVAGAGHVATGTHLDLVRLLLAGGADVNMRDASGSTPLSLAEHEGSREIVELLLARGAASTPDATKSRA